MYMHCINMSLIFFCQSGPRDDGYQLRPVGQVVDLPVGVRPASVDELPVQHEHFVQRLLVDLLRLEPRPAPAPVPEVRPVEYG
jgi:hypothetical protein